VQLLFKNFNLEEEQLYEVNGAIADKAKKQATGMV
jgi:hypothetical protein